MRTERYASRLRQAVLSSSAKDLLQRRNYIGFFTSCGANYVRSIRRAQEVSAIFKFASVSSLGDDDNNDGHATATAKAFSAELEKVIKGSSGLSDAGINIDTTAVIDGIYSNETYAQILDSLTIETLPYGINYGGSVWSPTTFTSLYDFNSYMVLAKYVMTTTGQSKQVLVDDDGNVVGVGVGIDPRDIGKISAVEVVPWVDEASFLSNAGFSSGSGNSIVVPKPRGLIANAQLVQGDGDGGGVDSSKYKCSFSFLVADNFGKCCDIDDMVYIYNNINFTYLRKCNPQEVLSDAVMRDNVQTNAEFVTLLESILRNKYKRISTLEQCLSDLHALPTAAEAQEYEYYYVRPNNNMEFDTSLEKLFTVKELKAAFDPRTSVGDGGLDIVPLLNSEVEEYVEMFYQPCLDAFYTATNVGTSIGTNNIEPRLFAAKPWYNHDVCTRKSCLEPNMAWDRKFGNGCVRGLIGRQDSDAPIPEGSDEYCSKQTDALTGEDYCKYTPDPEYFAQIDTCRESLPQTADGRGRSISFSVARLIDSFCMPELDTENGQADEVKMQQADQTEFICTQQQ